MGVREADQFPVVVFGASLGGIEALSTLLSDLPKQFPAAIAIVQHRSSEPGIPAEVLSRRSGRTVRDAAEGDQLAPGTIFLAPAGKHLLIKPDGSLALSDAPKVRSSRPAADTLFIVLVLGSKNPRLPGDHFQYVGIGVAAVQGSTSPGSQRRLTSARVGCGLGRGSVGLGADWRTHRLQAGGGSVQEPKASEAVSSAWC
jgi:hypothetical protein